MTYRRHILWTEALQHTDGRTSVRPLRWRYPSSRVGGNLVPRQLPVTLGRLGEVCAWGSRPLMCACEEAARTDRPPSAALPGRLTASL